MKQHTYYTKCENCGALLDPGEVCHCKEEPPQTPQYQDQLFYDLLAEQQGIYTGKETER